MKWILLIAFGVATIGCTHSPLLTSNTREPANGQNGPIANLFVYDSDVFNPNTTLQRFSDTKTIFSANQITGELIELRHEGNRCEFDPSIDSRRWPVECQFALQVYHASTKAIRFLIGSGAQIETPIIVTTQQEGAKCLALAGGREITLCQFSDEKLKNLLAAISPVIYHEATHLAQGSRMAQFVSARLSPLQEDHATLFSYMMSGKTEFLKELDGEGQKVYDKNAKFGWKPAGQYGSLIALTSLLIDLHRLTLQFTRAEERHKVHNSLSKIYLDLFLKATTQDNAQTVVKRVLNDISQMTSEIASFDRNEFRKIALQLIEQRFLSLEQTDFDGYLSALSYNGQPIDISPTRLLPNMTNDQLSAPKISFFIKKPTPEALSLFPMEIVLFSPEQMTMLSSCLSGKNLNDYKKSYKNCLIGFGKNGIRVRNGGIEGPYKRLNKPNEVVQFQFNPASVCKSIEALYAAVFDKDDNNLVTFTIPVGCK